MSVEKLASQYGLEYLAFLTLTFADDVQDPEEAQRRLNSLLTNVIRKRYRDYICVIERQKSGRIHFHLLVVLHVDIRTGVNWNEFLAPKPIYKSANPALRAEWLFWRKIHKKFGFGRTELLPVRSNKEAISKYVGKYISKHIGQRKVEDKGVRLVRFSKGAKVGTTNFSWVSPRSWLWRAKLRTWATNQGCATFSDVAVSFGPRWAYRHRREILETKLSYWPTVAIYEADGGHWPEELDREATDITRAPDMSAPENPNWRVPVAYDLDRNPETCRLYRERSYRQNALPGTGA